MNNNTTQQLEVLDIISLLGTLLGVLNYQENLKQTSNNEILSALKEQNNVYLEELIKLNKIAIEQNKEILNLLKGGEVDGI